MYYRGSALEREYTECMVALPLIFVRVTNCLSQTCVCRMSRPTIDNIHLLDLCIPDKNKPLLVRKS